MDDPLARFQREQRAHAISNKEEQNIRAGIQNYQAFALMEKSERTTRLQIRCANGLTHSASYTCLQDVCYDGFRATELILRYSFMQVKIKGKNLQALITAIEKHDCGYIQDYDKQFFNLPKPNDALIESIEMVIVETQ